METYTEINSVDIESPASVKPIETEKVRTMKEGVFFFENQNVLDNLSEKDNRLAYKNKALVYEQSKGVVTYPSPDWFYSSQAGLGHLIVDNADAFQEGTKILDIEFWYANKWVSVYNMFPFDGLPYTVFMDRVFFDLGEPALAMVYFPAGENTLFNALGRGDIEQMRVTFLPKTEEVTNE